MRSIRLALFAVGCSWIASYQAGYQLRANEAERAPVANAIGRFWGFGYSAGYHARYESRLGWNRYVPFSEPPTHNLRHAWRPGAYLPGSKMFAAVGDRVPGRGPLAPMPERMLVGPASVADAIQQPTATRSMPDATATIIESDAKSTSSRSPSASNTQQSPRTWMRQLLKPYADPPQLPAAAVSSDAPSPSDRSIPSSNQADGPSSSADETSLLDE